MKNVSIIIPAFNEEKTIKKLLNKILSIDLSNINFTKEIIIVDDGSTDKTAEICSGYKNIKLIKQNNMGKGSAVQKGILHSNGDYILVQDADMEYDPFYYHKLLMPFVEKKNNIAVFGSRYLREDRSLIKKPFKDQNIFAFFFNYFLSFLFLIVQGKFISDLLTGYKIYEKKFFNENKIYTKGFETDHEITVKLLKNQINIIEIPIKYYPRTKKEGKKISFKDAVKAVLAVIKYKFIN